MARARGVAVAMATAAATLGLAVAGPPASASTAPLVAGVRPEVPTHAGTGLKLSYSSDTAGYFAFYQKKALKSATISATVTTPTATCTAGDEGHAEGIYISGPSGSTQLAWVFLETLCSPTGALLYEVLDDVAGRWFNPYGPCAANIADPNYCAVYASPGQQVEFSATVTATTSEVTWDVVGSDAPLASGGLAGTTGGAVGETGFGLTTFGEPLPETSPILFTACTRHGKPVTHGRRYDMGAKGDVSVSVSPIAAQSFTLSFP